MKCGPPRSVIKRIRRKVRKMKKGGRRKLVDDEDALTVPEDVRTVMSSPLCSITGAVIHFQGLSSG
jgi:hypothetical protein